MSRLKGKNIVVYDCEIENVIDGVNVTWGTYDKMGLSVACLYDYQTDDNHVYFKKDLQQLCARLDAADLVVGFNTTGFDNKLLRALGGILKDDDELPNWDILEWSRKATGWDGSRTFPKGLKLDDHLEGTFGADYMKTGHGEMAPKWWQEGKVGQVVSYCLADVKRERMLFEHIVQHGWVKTKANGLKYIDLSGLNTVLDRVTKEVEKPTPRTPIISVNVGKISPSGVRVTT